MKPAMPLFLPDVPSPRLNGTRVYGMDRKGRVVLPAQFRTQLGEPFVLTRAPDRCLLALPMRTWRQVDQRRRRDRVFHEYFRTGAVECVTDTQTASTPTGRFLIPQELRRHAGLCGGVEVVFAGLGQAVLLTTRDRWDAHLAALERSIVEMLTSTFRQAGNGGQS